MFEGMLPQCRCKSFATLALTLLAACAPGAGPSANLAANEAEVVTITPVPQPLRNVILLVGDGLGTAYWSAAKLAGDSLAVESMPVVGLVDTRGTDHPRVTDSAAGATAYATGTRSYNGAISVGVRCQNLLRTDSAAAMREPAACDPLETLFEVARRGGMATGLVTTTRVTDATPAAFAAHVPTRRMEAEIANQLIRGGVDVMLGGGRAFFDGSARPDSQNLLEDLCARAVCLSTAADVAAYRPDERPVAGLFAPQDMPPASERSPTLEALARVALARLGQDPDGFVLLVEEEGTDNAGHQNRTLTEVLGEVRSLDRAVRAALDFARANPGTLVLVTADHETGGLSLQTSGDSLVATYTTPGHTAEMVPLFAFGPGAERFAGIHDNSEVGQFLKELVRSRP